MDPPNHRQKNIKIKIKIKENKVLDVGWRGRGPPAHLYGPHITKKRKKGKKGKNTWRAAPTRARGSGGGGGG
jgi:hypothetical protein